MVTLDFFFVFYFIWVIGYIDTKISFTTHKANTLISFDCLHHTLFISLLRENEIECFHVSKTTKSKENVALINAKLPQWSLFSDIKKKIRVDVALSK